MPILNYTTSIKADKTIADIQQILVKRGVQKLIVDYSDGNPVNLSFMIIWRDLPTAFSLPCNFEGVLKAMSKDNKVPRNLRNKEQALKVGWRILKDWIEAQMAIVDAELANMAEVFLPYAVAKNGSTLYKYLEQERDGFLLEN